MANPGVAPPDFDTPVGQLRALIGDTTYVPLVPPVVGQGDYTMYSDGELEAFLVQGGDSILRAAGWAYYALAAQAALNSSQIKDYDLAVDTRQRAADLRLIAQNFFDQADAEDASGEDAFFIVPTGRREANCWPELAPRPVCGFGRCFCGGCVV